MVFGATTLLFASPTLMPTRPMVKLLSSLVSQLFFLQEAAPAAAALIVDVLSEGLTTAKAAPAAAVPAWAMSARAVPVRAMPAEKWPAEVKTAEVSSVEMMTAKARPA